MDLYFYVYKIEKGVKCEFIFYYYPKYPRTSITGNVEVTLNEKEYISNFFTYQSRELDQDDKDYILNAVLKNLDTGVLI